mgnify:CR=1 FL=1
MAFSKSFARNVEGSNYPKWEEVYLTEEEEKQQERKLREDNLEIMRECLVDAQKLMKELKDYQTDLVSLAISLFNKRASHSVHYKEQKTKEKFDQQFKKE